MQNQYFWSFIRFLYWNCKNIGFGTEDLSDWNWEWMRNGDSPEREDGEGPVGLVAVGVCHADAPEVVGEELSERGDRQHVLVLVHGRHVVVHKLAMKTVEVAADGDGGHRAVDVAVGAGGAAAAALGLLVRRPSQPPHPSCTAARLRQSESRTPLPAAPGAPPVRRPTADACAPARAHSASRKAARGAHGSKTSSRSKRTLPAPPCLTMLRLFSFFPCKISSFWISYKSGSKKKQKTQRYIYDNILSIISAVWPKLYGFKWFSSNLDTSWWFLLTDFTEIIKN